MKSLMFNTIKSVALFLIVCIVTSCVEEIDVNTETQFESALVIEATITNELKHQEIKLSRTFRLEDDGPSSESNATINIVDNNGIIYNFQEAESGKYLSNNQFAAQPNIDYHLEITTSDGREYNSKTTQLTQQTQIDDLFFERGFNENNDEGVSVFLNSANPTGESKFYRFTYEETYKIIAPLYSPLELHIENEDYPFFFEDIMPPLESNTELIEFFVTRQFREEQEKICYNTVKSNEILLVSTDDFSGGVLENYKLRFLNKGNYIISHRYSILVRQYVQSKESYKFYSVLRDLSDSSSLLSQIQPGFLEGNVFSVLNHNEKVIGFFDVSTVTKQRIYFNYSDLFPNEPLPPYFKPCDDLFLFGLYVADPITGEVGYSPIQDAIELGYEYWDENLTGENLNVGKPYYMVLPYCGDCTVLGENIVPGFWEE
jgi:hypothetical protein